MTESIAPQPTDPEPTAPQLILIDGRAGSGKTTLADQLAEQLDAQIIHMDDLTPGWHGLHEASRAVETLLETGTWQRYDWYAGELAEHHRVDLARPLIIEGCGSITRAVLARAAGAAAGAGATPSGASTRVSTRASSVFSIWLECDETLRKQRALNRDGEAFAEFWEIWAEQELAHIEREQPDQLADLVCRGEQDKLAECSKLLFLSPVLAATSGQFSKREPRAN